MIRLPQTPEVRAVAERAVWFQPPAEALADPVRFLAYLMTYGTPEDLLVLNGVIGPDDYGEALAAAPAGIFDQRSWAYWNLKHGRMPAPPLPARELA